MKKLAIALAAVIVILVVLLVIGALDLVSVPAVKPAQTPSATQADSEAPEETEPAQSVSEDAAASFEYPGSYSEPGKYASGVIKTENVRLENLVFSGDLLIGGEAADSVVELNNVAVGGTLTVRGCADLSLNGCEVEALCVEREDTDIRIDKNTTVGTAKILDSDFLTVLGSCKSVTVGKGEGRSAECLVAGEDALVDSITINSAALVQTDCHVGSIDAAAGAQGAHLFIFGGADSVTAECGLSATINGTVGCFAISGDKPSTVVLGPTGRIKTAALCVKADIQGEGTVELMYAKAENMLPGAPFTVLRSVIADAPELAAKGKEAALRAVPDPMEDVDISWFTVSKTEYTITGAQQLKGLSRLVNGGESFAGKTIKLGGDIDLKGEGYVPAGTGISAFAGTLDGCGFTIKNMECPLFGSIEGGADTRAAVKNIALSTVKGGVGARALLVSGCARNADFELVETGGKMSAPESTGSCAGMVWAAEGCTFTQCINSAALSVGEGCELNTAGGTVCYAWGDLSFKECKNEGKLSVEYGGSGTWIGHVLAAAIGYGPYTLEFTDCSEKASISVASREPIYPDGSFNIAYCDNDGVCHIGAGVKTELYSLMGMVPDGVTVYYTLGGESYMSGPGEPSFRERR